MLEGSEAQLARLRILPAALRADILAKIVERLEAEESPVSSTRIQKAVRDVELAYREKGRTLGYWFPEENAHGDYDLGAYLDVEGAKRVLALVNAVRPRGQGWTYRTRVGPRRQARDTRAMLRERRRRRGDEHPLDPQYDLAQEILEDVLPR